MAGAPLALDANHPLEGFDCGKPALNDWLVRIDRIVAGITGPTWSRQRSDGNDAVRPRTATRGRVPCRNVCVESRTRRSRHAPSASNALAWSDNRRLRT